MHKIGRWVVSNTAALQGESGVPQVGGGDAGQADIDRHGLHVQALAGHHSAMRAQKRIAPGSPVAADHVDFGVGLAQLRGEIVEQVENPGIVVADIAGAVIAQLAVQAIERRGNVMAALAVDDIEAFAGMQVEELEPVRRRGGS